MSTDISYELVTEIDKLMDKMHLENRTEHSTTQVNKPYLDKNSISDIMSLKASKTSQNKGENTTETTLETVNKS